MLFISNLGLVLFKICADISQGEDAKDYLFIVPVKEDSRILFTVPINVCCVILSDGIDQLPGLFLAKICYAEIIND